VNVTLNGSLTVKPIISKHRRYQLPLKKNYVSRLYWVILIHLVNNAKIFKVGIWNIIGMKIFIKSDNLLLSSK